MLTANNNAYLGTEAGIAGVDSCSCSLTPSIVLKRLLLCAHVACFYRVVVFSGNVATPTLMYVTY